MRKNNRILFITPFYYGVGGVESSLNTLVAMLRRKGYLVDVCTIKTNPKRFAFFEGDKFFVVGYLAPRLLLKALFKRNIGLIHCAGFTAGLVGMIISRIKKVSYVMSTHAIYEGIYKLGNIEKEICARAERVLCLTRKSSDEIDMTHCLEYTTLVDPEVFRPMECTFTGYKVEDTKYATHLVSKTKPFTVLFVARPIEKKGWKVVEKVRENLPWVNFFMVSDVPNKELPAYYNAADLTITASQYTECFSRVIIESLMCGTPVLYSNKDVAFHYVDIPYAYHCEPTVEELTRKIELFATNEKFLPTRERCREYALQKFGEQNLEVFTNVYKECGIEPTA